MTDTFSRAVDLVEEAHFAHDRGDRVTQWDILCELTSMVMMQRIEQRILADVMGPST